MDEETNEGPTSDASSPFPLEPITASVLRRKERRRRDAIATLEHITVGCGEIDDYVLLGGLDRGSVVGLSAEDEAIGLHIALQAVARALVRGDAKARQQRAMVITTQPVPVVLPVLRDAVRLQLLEKGVEEALVREELRGCLERVVISRVFDLEGLWEVLEDLDAAGKEVSRDEDVVPEPSLPTPETKNPEPAQQKPPRVEVADSEDEEDFSASSSSPLSSPPASSPREASPIQPPSTIPLANEPPPPTSSLPDMIIITHFSSILATLFARRDPKPAHTALHLLSSHLRHLSRTLASNPLIMLLNSTSSSSSIGTAPRPSEKPLEPSLRSVFNPPPVGIPGYRHGAASRRNKPSYGLVFAQLLDVHILCTRAPREAADAERLYAPRPGGEEEAVRYVWVVEVLLDEVGTWEGGRRRFREQRWGAVDVVGGKVVDAFERGEERVRVRGEVRVVGGFGGPRV